MARTRTTAAGAPGAVRRRAVASAALAVLVAGCSTGQGTAPTAAPPSDGPTAAGPSSAAPGASAGEQVVVHGQEVPPLDESVDGYPTGTVRLVADGVEHVVPVLVAGTDEQRGHGLMEVADVPAGTGMAFTYDEDRTGAYTMRGTLTPLQIAWADADGRVVAMADMVPCDAEPCPTYPPDATYRLALEVRAGWLDELGVELGDTLLLEEDTSATSG